MDENEKLNICLKELTDVLKKHGYELFPQVVINDKGVHCNTSIRPIVVDKEQSKLTPGKKDDTNNN